MPYTGRPHRRRRDTKNQASFPSAEVLSSETPPSSFLPLLIPDLRGVGSIPNSDWLHLCWHQSHTPSCLLPPSLSPRIDAQQAEQQAARGGRGTWSPEF
uniref:Uncharacterized protein n=1 Tax=Arundo donax TaxID=35708 RepID=A0A0A9FAA8_ARUDO